MSENDLSRLVNEIQSLKEVVAKHDQAITDFFGMIHQWGTNNQEIGQQVSNLHSMMIDKMKDMEGKVKFVVGEDGRGGWLAGHECRHFPSWDVMAFYAGFLATVGGMIEWLRRAGTKP